MGEHHAAVLCQYRNYIQSNWCAGKFSHTVFLVYRIIYKRFIGTNAFAINSGASFESEQSIS